MAKRTRNGQWTTKHSVAGLRSLDDLPNELVVAVLGELWSSDREAFLSFACTSQRAYDNASKALLPRWPPTWRHDANAEARCGDAALVCAALQACTPHDTIESVALLSRSTAKQLGLILLECEKTMDDVSIRHATGDCVRLWGMRTAPRVAFDVSAAVLRAFRPSGGSEGIVGTVGERLNRSQVECMAKCARSSLGRVVLVFATKSLEVFEQSRTGFVRAHFLWENGGGAGAQPVMPLHNPRAAVSVAVPDWTRALSFLRERASCERCKYATLVQDAAGLTIALTCDGETVFRCDFYRRVGDHDGQTPHRNVPSFPIAYLSSVGRAFETFVKVQIELTRASCSTVCLTARSSTTADVCLTLSWWWYSE
ncbi:Hypothetical protein UVM_LOCUS59 [uncultured virus]|nr:Hypothetical protein UVM_LOCUS59 [uncultured virus]